MPDRCFAPAELAQDATQDRLRKVLVLVGRHSAAQLDDSGCGVAGSQGQQAQPHVGWEVGEFFGQYPLIRLAGLVNGALVFLDASEGELPLGQVLVRAAGAALGVGPAHGYRGGHGDPRRVVHAKMHEGVCALGVDQLHLPPKGKCSPEVEQCLLMSRPACSQHAAHQRIVFGQHGIHRTRDVASGNLVEVAGCVAR